jgi:exopolysaccharide production protein ExoQ
MMSAVAPSARSGRVTLTISPTAVVTFCMLLALLFVFQLGSLSALAFLALGMVLVILRPDALLGETVRFGWMYLLPLWCVLTMFWSVYPALSLRYGVQLGLTMVFAATIASRLPPALFVRLVWASFAIAAVASLLFGQVRGDGLGWLGIYGSKNAFAMVAATFMLVSFAFALDVRAARIWRIMGVLGGVLAFILVLLAQSTGALIGSGLAMAAGLAIALIRRFSSGQRLFLGVTAGLALVIALLVLIGMRDTVLAFVLDTTGKDMTLTGRTDLWAVAVDEWRQQPMIGQGYQAFWVPGNPVAEQMWAMFGIATRTGFHFHNTWLSNAVEIGIIGVALQAAVFGTAVTLCLRWALRHPSAESLFLAMFMLRQAVLSMVEVVAFMQFDLISLLTVCAAVYGLRARLAQRARSGATRVWTLRAGGAGPIQSGRASSSA